MAAGGRKKRKKEAQPAAGQDKIRRCGKAMRRSVDEMLREPMKMIIRWILKISKKRRLKEAEYKMTMSRYGSMSKENSIQSTLAK